MGFWRRDDDGLTLYEYDVKQADHAKSRAAWSEGEVIKERLKPTSQANSVSAARNANAPLLIALALFSALVNFLMLTGPVFMLLVYDLVLPSHSWETLLALTLAAGFLFVIFGLLEQVRGRLASRLATRIVQKLRSRLVDGTVWLGVRLGGGGSAARSFDDLDVIQSYYGGPPFLFWFDLPVMPLYFLVIFLLHPWFGAYGILALCVLLPVALLFHRRAQKPLQAAEQAGVSFKQLAHSVQHNAEAAGAMGMGPALRDRFFETHDQALISATRARDRMGTLGSATRALRLALQSGILAVGAWLVIRGEIGAGAMVAASIILGRALHPVDQFIARLQMAARFRDAKQRINDLLAVMPREKHRTIPISKPKGILEVRDLLVFAPHGKTPILTNLRFQARPGRILAIRGPNGVGKSSLLRTLVGVWPVRPNAGQVRLDGATLAQWPATTLGKLIGYLPQESALFDGSIRDNIARLAKDVPDEAVHHAADLAGVSAMIRAMGGYDLSVGPGGGRLSVGQRQRIAMARALFGDPLLIVLDEPDAALDAAGLQALIQVLLTLSERDRTIILTDHHGALSNLADDLLILEFDSQNRGRQIAFGPREAVESRIRKSQGGPGQQPQTATSPFVTSFGNVHLVSVHPASPPQTLDRTANRSPQDPEKKTD